MKKTANTTVYNDYSTETNFGFSVIAATSLLSKSDIDAKCSQINYLFHEKLPIIYANIRV